MMPGLFDFLLSGGYDDSEPGRNAQMALAAGLMGGKGSFGSILGNSLMGAQDTYRSSKKDQLGSEMTRAQIDELKRRAEAEAQQRELERMKLTQRALPKFGSSPLGIFNEGTGEVVSPAPAKAEKENAIIQLMGAAGIDPMSPQGRKILSDALTKQTTHAPPMSMNQYGGMQAGVGPTGQPAFAVTDKQGNLKVLEGFAPPPKPKAAEKNLTEDQGKATSWLERMNQAESVIAKAPESALTSLGSTSGMAGAVVGGLPMLGKSSFGQMARSALETPERQAVRTAQETWVQGLLRSDTGAAYKDMEKDDIIRAFFWQPGEADSQKQIKQNLREGVRRAMQVRAGPGVERLEAVPKSASPVSVDAIAAERARRAALKGK